MTDDRKYIYVKGKKVYVSDELLCYNIFCVLCYNRFVCYATIDL